MATKSGSVPIFWQFQLVSPLPTVYRTAPATPGLLKRMKMSYNIV